ncbi:MAG: hypothetical protein R3A47_05280 [Polyangiales bacterium]
MSTGNLAAVIVNGEEMRELKFKMPAPSMYVVPEEGTKAYEGMVATFPETVQFMKEGRDAHDGRHFLARTR